LLNYAQFLTGTATITIQMHVLRVALAYTIRVTSLLLLYNACYILQDIEKYGTYSEELKRLQS